MMEKTMNECKIVFLGDSFTNRTGVKYASNPEKKYSTSYTGSYTEFVEKRLFVNRTDKELRFFNLGISGDKVADVLDRFRKDFIELSPDIVVLLIGHNDVKKIDLNSFKNKYRKLINILEKRAEKVIGISILPMVNHVELDTKIEKFNDVIKDTLLKKGFIYLDLYGTFLNIMRNLNKSVALFEETNHLSELGNILIADKVYDLINNHLEDRK